ncbi:MAG: HAD family hydrolase [Egibacteraceae bacterium]
MLRTARLLDARGVFVVTLRRKDLSFRRSPATRLLGHYRDRTFTGKSTATCQDTLGRTDPNPALLKPHPHLILQAVQALCADPATCTLIGDSVSDIEGGLAAGCHSQARVHGSEFRWHSRYSLHLRSLRCFLAHAPSGTHAQRAQAMRDAGTLWILRHPPIPSRCVPYFYHGALA